MRRSSDEVKFPNSSTLFKFTHRVLSSKKGARVNNQEVGKILTFKASDCSNWKRGAKNVRSIEALNNLAQALGVDHFIIYDIISGFLTLDEAFFEYQESLNLTNIITNIANVSADEVQSSYMMVTKFVEDIHSKANFQSPPLYLLEVIRLFSIINIQSTDIVDKLSRVLKVKSSKYMIHYKSGAVKPQIRLSATKDLAKIFLEAERAKFKELGEVNPKTIEFEKFLFSASLLCPKSLLEQEIKRLDSKSNITSDLASLFWVPRIVINFQLKSLLSESHLGMHIFTGEQKDPYRPSVKFRAL